MGEEQGLSAENRALVARILDPVHYSRRSLTEGDFNRLLDAARSEGLQPSVGEVWVDGLGSVGSGLTPLVPSPSASGLIAQPSDGEQ